MIVSNVFGDSSNKEIVLSAKEFRTWAGTVLAAMALNDQGCCEVVRERRQVASGALCLM
jgi:DNA topoisomerase IB